MDWLVSALTFAIAGLFCLMFSFKDSLADVTIGGHACHVVRG